MTARARPVIHGPTVWFWWVHYLFDFWHAHRCSTVGDLGPVFVDLEPRRMKVIIMTSNKLSVELTTGGLVPRERSQTIKLSCTQTI